MPELPEMEALRLDLAGRLVGRRLERVELASVSALKTYDPPLDAVVGATVEAVERRGKFLCLRLGASAPSIVVHLARGGWVRWHDAVPAKAGRPGKGPLALRVAVSGGCGFDVTEMGTQKRLAIFVVGDPRQVPGIARLGPEPLDPAFDRETLAAALAARPTVTVKRALTDQQVVAGLGNAYSDEVLHAARLSPFRPCGRLSAEEVARLHAAIRRTLEEALARQGGRPVAELKGEKREGLAVHGRAGERCSACGDTVREVRFAERSLEYCPSCQTGGKVLADRRLSRLLK